MPPSLLHVLLAVIAMAPCAARAAPAAQGAPRDETSKGYAFVEVVLPRRAPFVGEAFTATLRAGVDIDVLEANLVQPFRQPLDVPVQLDHAWFEGAAVPQGGLTALGPARAAGDGAESTPDAPLEVARVALGAALASAARHVERGAGGRRFTVLELQRTFVADSPGTLAVPEARLGFAYALEFRDDLVAGRVALDRHDAFVRSGPQELAVRALPEAGRPFSFTGAVGRYSLTATLAPERIVAAGTTQLTVTLTAEDTLEGALAGFAGPRLDRLSDFDVVASSDTIAGSTRTFVAELAPRDRARAGALVIEPLEFAAFDPVAERYVELTTPRLTVHVGSPSTDGPAPDAPGPSEGATGGGGTPADSAFPWVALGGAAALLVLALFVLRTARARR